MCFRFDKEDGFVRIEPEYKHQLDLCEVDFVKVIG